MWDRVRRFIQDSRQEFKRVNWPTRKKTVRYTFFVIGLAVVVSLFLGFLDFIFLRILERII